MDNKPDHTRINRSKCLGGFGEVYIEKYADELKDEEYEKTRIELWNNIVYPEIEEILNELFSERTRGKLSTARDRIDEFWLEHERQSQAAYQWLNRRTRFRFMNGCIYQFCLDPAIAPLFDGFAFKRFKPGAFTTYVQRFLENIGNEFVKQKKKTKIYEIIIACSIIIITALLILIL